MGGFGYSEAPEGGGFRGEVSNLPRIKNHKCSQIKEYDTDKTDTSNDDPAR